MSGTNSEYWFLGMMERFKEEMIGGLHDWGMEKNQRLEIKELVVSSI